jgi:hypothetical protein
MPNQHKYRPIGFRPPEADRAWLLDHAEQTGRSVNGILARALAAYRNSGDCPECAAGDHAAATCTTAACGCLCSTRTPRSPVMDREKRATDG